MIKKYRVTKTKSGRKWVAWQVGKKSQGRIYDTWDMAIKWATMISFCERVMME